MLRVIKRLFTSVLGVEKRLLCDTCKYDFGSACKRPERPNATKCPDYRKAK